MALRIDDVDLVRDRTLVERFQAGDESAFDELYTRYYRRLARFCAKRVGDVAEAEEVAQEAFARAYTAMPRLAGERRFYPWVSVIAARLCVDTHRRRARTQPSDEIDLGSTDGGHDAIHRQVDLDLLSTAMERLGPRHREVLELREHEGWSYQRIAEHYDVSLGTVEALLFRARKALRREFLAVAGDTPRGWAFALPGMGWASRKLLALRARTSIVTDHAPQLLAGSAAVVALGSMTILGTGAGAPEAVRLDGPAPKLHAGLAAASIPLPAAAAVSPTTVVSLPVAVVPTATSTTSATSTTRSATPLPGLTKGSGGTPRPTKRGDLAIDVPTAAAIVNVPTALAEGVEGITKVVKK